MAARLEFDSWAVHPSAPFLLLFFFVVAKEPRMPQPFVFVGEMSGNVWSCFLCQKPWAAENGWWRDRNQLKGSPAFSIFPSDFIDRMPRAEIGEGSVLASGFSLSRKRISAGWSGVVAQLLSAGQMVWTKLVKMCVQLLCLLVLGWQGCTPATPQDATPQASSYSSATHKFTTAFWSSQVRAWLPLWIP